MIRQIWLLARRDLVQRARSRAFVITLLITVGAMLALGPLISVMANRSGTVSVGMTGPAADATLSRTIDGMASASGLTVHVAAYPDRAAGESAVRDGTIAVLVVADPTGSQLVWKDIADSRTESVLSAAVQQVERSEAAATLGLGTSDVARLIAPAPPTSTTLAPADPQRTGRLVAASVVVVLIYIAIVMFGQFVLVGVMEEKSNRVVEVVLSRARPTEVLAGKVVGIGLLGLIEMAALGVAGWVTVRTVHVAGLESLPPIGFGTVIAMLGWFVLGYVFYAVVYAALGATVSRQEDSQGAAFLPTMLLLPGYFIGLRAAENPDNVWVRVGSLLPPWSPVVMPARIAIGTASWWEVVLAVALLLLSAWGLTVLGGRIYTGAILRIGRKVPWREAWRGASRSTSGTSVPIR